MNKKSLLNKAAYKSDLRKDLAKKLFDRMVEIINESLKEEKEFTIEEFGRFEVVHRKMQKGIDHKKKAEVLLPPKDKIVFTPSQILLDNINRS